MSIAARPTSKAMPSLLCLILTTACAAGTHPGSGPEESHANSPKAQAPMPRVQVDFGDSVAFVARLDALEKSGSIDELLKVATTMHSGRELAAAMDWLKLRVFAGRGGARYAHAYAFDLWRMADTNHNLAEGVRGGLYESAIMSVLYAKVVGRVDAVRRVDSSAVSMALRSWEGDLRKVFEGYLEAGPEKRLSLLNLAFDMERKHLNRASDTWMCRGGISQFVEYDGKLTEGTPIELPGHAGSQGVLLDLGEPKIVPKEVWLERRSELVPKLFIRLRDLPPTS